MHNVLSARKKKNPPEMAGKPPSDSHGLHVNIYKKTVQRRHWGEASVQGTGQRGQVAPLPKGSPCVFGDGLVSRAQPTPQKKQGRMFARRWLAPTGILSSSVPTWWLFN